MPAAQHGVNVFKIKSNDINRGVLMFAACSLVSAGFILLSGVMDGSARVLPFGENFDLASAVTNALPGMLLVGVLWGASGRALISILIPIAICAAIFAINRLKLEHVQSPLTPQDVEFFITAPWSSWSLFSNYVPWYRILLSTVVAMSALVVLLRRVHRQSKPTPLGPLRVVTGAGATMMLLSLLMPGGLAPRIYKDKGSAAASFDALLSRAEFPGVINNLMAPQHRYVGYFRNGVPEVAAASVNKAFSTTLPEECRASNALAPDIVFVQSEAFFDVAQMNGMGAAAAEVIPNFRALSQQGVHGDLYVPTLGGNTIRTEYEVLTGQPLWADPEITYPYFEIGAFNLPSMISTLSRSGYKSISIHGNSGAFWRRWGTFRELGFNRQVWRDAFAEKDESDFYMPDRLMTDEILRVLQEPSSAPRMVYAISIENHGPYEYHPAAYHQSRDTKPESKYQLPDSLTDGQRAKLRTYLYHLANADHELGRLVAVLKQRSRPAIVVFFGDHLPAMPRIFDSQQMVSGLSKDRQPTSWLMIGINTQSLPEQRVDIASWQLAAYALMQARICDPYFAVIARMDPAIAKLTSAAERAPRPPSKAVKASQESALQLALLQRSDQACAAYDQVSPAISSQMCPGGTHFRQGRGLASAPAASVTFGRYVEPRKFEVEGVGTQFKVTDRVFAAVRVAGPARAATVQMRMLDSKGLVVAEQVHDIKVSYQGRINFALSDAARAPIMAGIYTVETLVDGKVANTTQLAID